MKDKRQETIISVITNEVIATQEALLKRLNELGFNTTQATISRDIKKLKLVKIHDVNGIIRYSVTNTNQNTAEKSIFMDAILNVDYAINTVVIKCKSGTAQAACAYMDMLEIPTIVGTLAGDDTIFILMRTEKDAQLFVENINDNLQI